MFDSARIEALLAARLPGHSLPQGLYNDPEAFAFDLEAIFGQCWTFAAFEAEVREPGSYLSLLIGGSPIIVVRGREGSYEAFITPAATAVQNSARSVPAGRHALSALITNGFTHSTVA